MTNKPPKDDVPAMSLDELARRMLASPPQHKVKPKPAAKPAQNKPAK